MHSSITPEGYTESVNIGEKEGGLSETLSSPLKSEETVLHQDLNHTKLVHSSSTKEGTELSPCSNIYEGAFFSKHTKKPSESWKQRWRRLCQLELPMLSVLFDRKVVESQVPVVRMRILGSSVPNMKNVFSISEIAGQIAINFQSVRLSKQAGDTKISISYIPRKISCAIQESPCAKDSGIYISQYCTDYKRCWTAN